ncbi:hypothetical protein DUK53_15025 [Listeria sp. SHR_NRA_18]|uniref:hypothetical protein n=1 Tax=Listeria sp. SHR_NRA_18 TaxID=2269046 RepID=UPI000F5E6D55|nr:hypothetical protein [Listeria sp. SHR_NRA_18]RQW65700.1 hypothetical protein DUK53_15025 [Listeria sp. SHR_NRA_18]
MRYDDLPYRFETGFEDPLQLNVTVDNPIVIGVFAPDTKLYLKLENNNRVSVNTDEGGKFEYEFDGLEVDNIISFQIKNASQYLEFWQETIRE